MATSDIPRSASPWRSPSGPAVRVREPGELVAAVPVLLGFHPRESLVLVATGGGSGRRLGLTLRVDLPPPEHVRDHAACAAEHLLLDTPTGAAVVVVAAAAAPHVELVGHVIQALERHQVRAHTVLWAESTSEGARWSCYDTCECTGVVPDFSTTTFAAAAVTAGQVVWADRREIEALVAPADPERIRRREALLIQATDEALARSDPGAVVDAAVVDAAVADAAADRLVLDDARVVALAGALAVPAIRDSALLQCIGPAAAAAEQLWTALVRETPDPEAAEPAVLLAVSALMRGDGALANIALDRAEHAWPGHRLAAIVRSGLLGMRPEQIRELLRDCEGHVGGAVRRERLPRRGRS
ncbi:DUF4192 domain-containing protein [Pseudonocardia alaniniphila]|uniref:DUF4192 domain-containing protein n=1 Tax=Pseudonocardia alaniniphila TaxID=75291 RepID=A0ABS9TCG8_9PSEU|nr:DUF4192 domain-containing protein [Pseudonocardia alaniniphila]MCH6166093.1 DUF4192 domain-containing protein [Pseudonocardia alaniniphila]